MGYKAEIADDNYQRFTMVVASLFCNDIVRYKGCIVGTNG